MSEGPNTIIEGKDGTKVTILAQRGHNKASEIYVDVEITYPDSSKFECSVPIRYRRTGVDFSDASSEELNDYLIEVAAFCHNSKWEDWRNEQEEFWKEKKKAIVSKPFYDVLAEEFKWCSVSSDFPPNPNWARRTQFLKELGYTLATIYKKDDKTNKNATHIMILPLPRGRITGYEDWSPKLRKKIVKQLRYYDAFESKTVQKDSLIPDHKFPEIRWDENTKRPTLEDLSDEEIKRDFQLIDNQRNQQKREVCRSCFQHNKRGYPYGIQYYYAGDENWPEDVPKTGKEAETGCIGCGWYDLEAWRQSIKKVLVVEEHDC